MLKIIARCLCCPNIYYRDIIEQSHYAWPASLNFATVIYPICGIGKFPQRNIGGMSYAHRPRPSVRVAQQSACPSAGKLADFPAVSRQSTLVTVVVPPMSPGVGCCDIEAFRCLLHANKAIDFNHLR